MKLYTQIFENSRRWVADRTNTDKDFFEHLAKGQSPEILYIGCSGSRVTAGGNDWDGTGTYVVHRNIANLVPNSTDTK